MRSYSYGNALRLHVHFHVNQTHFHSKCFAQELTLKFTNGLSVGRLGGLMVSALKSGAIGPGSSPGRGHFAVFLGKTLYSHGASLHPGV